MNIVRLKSLSINFFFLLLFSSATYILWGYITDTRVVNEVRNVINDRFTYQKLYRSNVHNDDIVIIRIDDYTLDTFWRSDLWMLWFDKWVHAQVIQNLFEKYNAAVVWVDIVYANPSVLWEADEKKLFDVLETYKDKIILATRSDKNPHPLCIYSNVRHGYSDIWNQSQIRLFNTEDITYQLEIECPQAWENSEAISTFWKEVIWVYKRNMSPLKAEELEYKLQNFYTQATPSLINYFHNWAINSGTLWYTSYSFADIYTGIWETSQWETIDLSEKIVLIWEVWTLLHDRHFTPISRNVMMPWVEIQANIIQTLLNWDPLKIFWYTETFFLYLLLQLPLIVSIFFMSFLSSLFFLIFLIIVVVLIWATLFSYGVVFDIFLVSAILLINYFLLYIYKYFITDSKRRHLKKQFSLYVSPDLVDEISNIDSSDFLNGEKRMMSIYFSDIANFTSISELVDTRELVNVLNEYFHEMTLIIHKNQGTLDKYIGDAVMCFFNAPLHVENHSFLACKTALEQKQKLQELNKIWKIHYSGIQEDISIRIWIHTGEAIHGNIGSVLSRVNYTIIWDSVNLASRLESVSKKYGIAICVSDEVYQREKDNFYFRKIDTQVLLKWKKTPTNLYELVCNKDEEIDQDLQEVYKNYSLWLEAYEKFDYKMASKYFLKNPTDITSMYMLQRSIDIQQWKIRLHQGIFMMDEK